MSYQKVSIERPQVDSIRAVTNKTTGEQTFIQKIWLYKSGSKHPTEYAIRLPMGIRLYPEGDYLIDLQTNIRPDKYQGLSFDNFAATRLITVTPQQLQQFEKFLAELTQILIPKQTA